MNSTTDIIIPSIQVQKIRKRPIHLPPIEEGEFLANFIKQKLKFFKLFLRFER